MRKYINVSTKSIVKLYFTIEIVYASTYQLYASIIDDDSSWRFAAA